MAGTLAANADPARPGCLDLAESTVRSLTAREALELLGPDLDAVALDYGAPAGAHALREAVAACCGISANRVLTVPGTMLGLLLLAGETCRDGGEAVLVTPCFGPALGTLARAGASVRTVGMAFDDAYRLDIGRIVAAAGPATRLICIANPQNPGGGHVPDAVLRDLLGALSHAAPDALLCLDETYREATYGDAPPYPSAATLDRRIVTLGSVSKAHGAPGLRVGWLTVPDAALHRRLVAAKLDLLISGSVLDEAIAAAILRRPDAVLRPRRRALGSALGTVLDWHRTREPTRLDLLRPEAGALCCARLSRDRFDAAAVRRFWAAVPERGLRLAPGSWFGETDRVFRIGFGHVAPGALPGALAAVSAAVDAADR